MSDSSENTLAYPFEWMQQTYDELRKRFSAMRQKIATSSAGMEWSAIEDDEAEVARMLLMLDATSFVHPWVVPIERQYLMADNQPVMLRPNPSNGYGDARDFAIKCRITIASPDCVLLGFDTAACWARGEKPPAGYDEEFNLHALDDPLIRRHLDNALAVWQQVIDEHGNWLVDPLQIPARRLATQLRRLCVDIDNHRYHLHSCEWNVKKFDKSHGPYLSPGPDALIWHRHALVIDAGHQRITRHLEEILPQAEGIAPHLEYGMRDEAGSIETRTLKALHALHNHFRFHAQRFGDPDVGENCGYLYWHFDGHLHNNFKEWWRPIHDELVALADDLSAVAIKPADPATKSVTGPSLHAEEQTTKSKAAKRNEPSHRPGDIRALLSYYWICKKAPNLIPTTGKTKYTQAMYDYLAAHKADCRFYRATALPKKVSWASMIRRALREVTAMQTGHALAAHLPDVDVDDVAAVLSDDPAEQGTDPDELRHMTHRFGDGE